MLGYRTPNEAEQDWHKARGVQLGQLGRKLTGADGTGKTATTSYDTAGRAKTFDDGKGVYTYSYDGTDALGKAEHRGLTTRVDLGYASGDTDVVTVKPNQSSEGAVRRAAVRHWRSFLARCDSGARGGGRD